jgi:hypothetical protein
MNGSKFDGYANLYENNWKYIEKIHINNFNIKNGFLVNEPI